MRNKVSIVYGVGVNDADYNVTRTSEGKKIHCAFYVRWKGMLERCYSERFKRLNPAYAGCSVSNDWLVFSNFRAWMVCQDWQGKELDKDLLSPGNRIYSKENCIFITPELNLFIADRYSSKTKSRTGSSFHKRVGKFRAMCNNPVIGGYENLGYFSSEESAHNAWLLRKHQIAVHLANLQSDERVSRALISRYA